MSADRQPVIAPIGRRAPGLPAQSRSGECPARRGVADPGQVLQNGTKVADRNPWAPLAYFLQTAGTLQLRQRR